MKKYNLQYRNFLGGYCYKLFTATCDTDARFEARMMVRQIQREFGCAPALFDFNGNYIEL